MALLPLLMFLLFHGLCLGLLDLGAKLGDSYGSGGHSCAGVSNNSTKDDPKDIAIAKEQDSPKLSDLQLFTDLQSFFQASSAATSAPFNSKLSDSFSQSPVLPVENFREVPRGLKPSILSYLAKFWFARLMSDQAFADKLNSNPLQAIPVDSLVSTSPAGHQFEKPLIHMAKLLLPFLVPAQRTIPGSSLLGNLKYSTLRPQAGFHPVPSMPLESPSSFGHLVDPLSAPPVFHEVPLSQAVGGLPSALSTAPSGSSIEVDQASPKLLVVSSRHFSTLLETYPNIIPDTKTSNTAMPFSIGSPQPAPASPVIRGTVSPEGESPSWMSPSSVPIIDMPGLPFPPRGASPNMFHLTTPSALPSSSMHSAGPPPSSFPAHETFPLQGDGGSPAPLMGLELVPSPQSHPKAEVPVFLAEPPLSLPVLAPNVILNPLSFNSPQLQPAFPPVPSMMGPGNNLPFQDPTRPVSIQASPNLPSPPRKAPDRNRLNSPAPTEIPTMTDQIPLQTPQSVLIPPMPGLPSAPVVGKRLEAPAPYPTDSSQHTKHSTLGNPIPSTKVNDPQSHPHVMPPVLHDIVHVPSETPGYNFQVPSSHNLVPSLAPLQESHAPYADNSPLYISHSPLSDWKRHHKHLIAPASVSAPFQGLGPGSSSRARFPVHSSPGHIQSPFRAPQIVEPKPVPPNPLLMPPLPNAGPAQVPAEPPQRESKPAIPKLPITSPSPPQDQGHLQTPLQVPPVIQPMPAAPRNPITFQSPKIGHKGFPVGAPKPAIPKSPKTLFLPPRNPGHAHAPDGKPQIEPEPAIPRKPRIFPSPPPRPGCVRASCSAPYTQTLSGTPCGCVLPIQVELELGVALYALFPLISVLAEEVANGTLLLQSQVHITGADADSENQERSIVDISLVPLADAFDRVTALMIFWKFWKHLVYIDAPLFGDYTVIFVRYPGLPPSPPSKNPAEIVPGEPFQVTGSNAEQPLGVEIRRGHNKIGTGTIAVIAPSAAIAGVICLGIIWFMLAKCSNNSKLPLAAEPVHTTSMPKRSGGGSLLSSEMASSTSMSLASSMATYTGSAKMFTLYELEKATNVFNSQNVVGEGGFGRVYHGILDDGTMVAVKVLTRDDEQGGKEFMAEVEMLSRLHHRNLVKLIGICIEEHSRCLVYEFVPNGSLESHLHGMDRKLGPMDWYTRMKIALGAARGLAYLHEDSNPRVIHRDFKASNILLEDDFTPKVSDFGLAKAAPDDGNGHISTRVMGTFGYVAPEYAMTGHLLVKSDVYSYGVVLLELLSGRKPVDMSQPPGQENLVTWARPLLSSREGLQILVDPGLGSSISFDNVAKVAAIASMCVQPEVSDRPFMGEVVQALKLVYNDTDVSNGIRSINGSLALRSPFWEGHGISRAQHTRDVTSFMSTEYDSSSIHGDDLEKRPLSASGLFSDSRWLLRQHSDSFRRHATSGPSRTNRENSPCYRASQINHGSMSDHALCRYFTGSIDRDFYRLWP